MNANIEHKSMQVMHGHMQTHHDQHMVNMIQVPTNVLLTEDNQMIVIPPEGLTLEVAPQQETQHETHLVNLSPCDNTIGNTQIALSQINVPQDGKIFFNLSFSLLNQSNLN
jgi:hypothetical protein